MAAIDGASLTGSTKKLKTLVAVAPGKGVPLSVKVSVIEVDPT